MQQIFNVIFLSVSPPFLFLPALSWTLSLIHSFSYRLIWFIVHYFSWQSHYGPESCPLVLNAPAELSLLLQCGEYCVYFMPLCTRTHAQCMRGRNELGLNHTTQMKGLWPWTPKGEAAWQLKRLSWLLCDSDSAVKETTGAQNVVCELNGLRVSVIFINHYRIFCETSRDVIMKKLCKSHSLKAWIAGI